MTLTIVALLSASLVSAAAIAGMWLGDIAAPSDVIPFILMLAPPVFASGWIVAKAFVWTRNWRIVPPGYSAKYPKLQIQQLMLGTLLCAAYLASSQLLVEDLESWFEEDLITTAVYLCVPSAVCAVISCLLARIMMDPSNQSVVVRTLALAMFATAGMTMPEAAMHENDLAVSGQYHVRRSGEIGTIYNIGAGNEITNLDLTGRILSLLGPW